MGKVWEESKNGIIQGAGGSNMRMGLLIFIPSSGVVQKYYNIAVVVVVWELY